MSTNNCCGDSAVQSINTFIPGPAGSSYYVYVAYATTVSNVGQGNSSAQSGFQLTQPTSTSAYFAILTSPTIVNNGSPTAVNFQGLWAPFGGVTVSGINLEQAQVLVANGPFNTVNFQGTGLSGVTVVNDALNQATVEITTAAFIKTYYSQIKTLATNGQLKPGSSYWIVDVGDGEGAGTNNAYKAECEANYYDFATPNFTNYAHNAGIVVRALTPNKLAAHAIYLARVPNPINTSFFQAGKSYAVDTRIVSYNQVFQFTAGGVLNTEPADTPATCTYVPRQNNNYYVLDPQLCIYELESGTSPYGIVRARWDSKGNYVRNLNPSSTGTNGNEFMKNVFRWGTTGIVSNTINFWDDSNRRPANDSKRSPAFQDQLINYCNIANFRSNKIDLDLGASDESTKTGTRFFNIYIDSKSDIHGNTFNNATITNINDLTLPATNIQNNVIENSIVANTNINSFLNNSITDNSVIGDLYFINSTLNLLPNATFTSIPTSGILNNLGSKTWAANGNSTTTITVAGSNVTINFGGTVANAAVGDIVHILSAPAGSNLAIGYYTITAASVSSPYTSITFVASGVTTTTGAVSVNFYAPAISTSFATFSNNLLSNTIVRGLNKQIGTGCIFSGNTITNSILENYAAHTPTITGVFDANSFYSDPGEEFGKTNGTIGFSNNNIKYSLFLNNKIVNTSGAAFYNNIIEGATFKNNNNIAAPNIGLEGAFYSNSIISSKGQYPLDGFTNYRSAVSPIQFTNNSFYNGSFFRFNSIENQTIITGVSLNTGSNVADCKFLGQEYQTFTGELTAASYTPGLFQTVLQANVQFRSVTFEGRSPALGAITLANVDEAKQITGAGGGNESTVIGSTYFENFNLKDVRLLPKAAPYNVLKPFLFQGNPNPIRNITYAEGSAVNSVVGGITFKTTTYTLTITTHLPHLINQAFVGSTVALSVGSFTSNFVRTDAIAIAQYQTFSTSGSSGGFLTRGTVTNIIDEYTFVATITGQIYLGALLLHSSNNVLDIDGTAAPGPGLVGTYNDANDPSGNVRFPFVWYSNYGKVKQTFVTTNNFAVIEPNSFDAVARISMAPTIPVPNIPGQASNTNRLYAAWKNYATSTGTVRLYDSSVDGGTLTLPHYIDSISSTIVLGTHQTAATYQVSRIVDMPNLLPVRFVAGPGCTVQFNLTPAASITANSIIKDSAAASYTITSRVVATDKLIYDELILMRDGDFIKVISKIINQ
jgi:hypothetical protein